MVLMDCEMPVMDGFKRREGSADRFICIFRFIAVTADEMSGDRERCLNQGMNDYSAKSVELGLLADMLAKWLPVTEELAQDGALPAAHPDTTGSRARTPVEDDELVARSTPEDDWELCTQNADSQTPGGGATGSTSTSKFPGRRALANIDSKKAGRVARERAPVRLVVRAAPFALLGP